MKTKTKVETNPTFDSWLKSAPNEILLCCHVTICLVTKRFKEKSARFSLDDNFEAWWTLYKFVNCTSIINHASSSSIFNHQSYIMNHTSWICELTLTSRNNGKLHVKHFKFHVPTKFETFYHILFGRLLANKCTAFAGIVMACHRVNWSVFYGIYLRTIWIKQTVYWIECFLNR